MLSQRLKTFRLDFNFEILLQALAFLFVLTLSPLARAVETPPDFKITLPGAWKLEKDGSFEGYFNRTSKKKPVITFEKLELKAEQTGFDFLASKRIKIEHERARLFSAFGLEHYTIVNVEEHTAKNGHKYQVIQSRYQGPLGQDVQMYERQYAFGSTVFRVTYTEETPALNELDRVKQILDNVQPVVPKGWREPASESETGRGLSTENSSGSKTVNGIPMERLRTPGDPNYCTDVPEKDRYTSDKDRSYVGMAWQVGIGGASCLYDQAKAILDLLKTTIDFFDFDSETSQQIRASVSTMASEFMKAPGDFMQKTGAKILEAVGEQYSKFQCYNLKNKFEMFCNTAITAAMLYRILLKIPLPLNLHEKLVAAIKNMPSNAKAVASNTKEALGKAGTWSKEKLADGFDWTSNKLRNGKDAIKGTFDRNTATSKSLPADVFEKQSADTLRGLQEVSASGLDDLTRQKYSALLHHSGQSDTLMRSLNDINTISNKADRIAKLKELRAILEGTPMYAGKIDEAAFNEATKKITELARGKGLGKPVKYVNNEAPRSSHEELVKTATNPSDLQKTSEVLDAQIKVIEPNVTRRMDSLTGNPDSHDKIVEFLKKLPDNEREAVGRQFALLDTDKDIKQFRSLLDGVKPDGSNAREVAKEIERMNIMSWKKMSSMAEVEAKRAPLAGEEPLWQQKTRLQLEATDIPGDKAQVLRRYEELMSKIEDKAAREELAYQIAKQKPGKIAKFIERKMPKDAQTEGGGFFKDWSMPRSKSAASSGAAASGDATASINRVRGIVAEKVPADSQVLKNYDALVNGAMSEKDRQAMLLQVRLTANNNPNKLGEVIEAQMRKFNIKAGEPVPAKPPVSSVGAVDAEADHLAAMKTIDRSASASAETAKSSAELASQQKEVSTLLGDNTLNKQFERALGNSSNAEKEAITAELRAALKSGNDAAINQAKAELANYKSAYGSQGVKSEQLLENLRNINNRNGIRAGAAAEPESLSAVRKIEPPSPEEVRGRLPTSEAQDGFDKIFQNKSLLKDASRREKLLTEIDTAYQYGKIDKVEAILKKYKEPNRFGFGSNLKAVEKELAALNRQPGLLTRMGRAGRFRDPVSNIKTSKFSPEVSLGSGSESEIQGALARLAGEAGEDGKTAQKMLTSYNGLTSQAKEVGSRLAQRDPDKFFRILEGYSRSSKVDSSNFITAVKNAEAGLDEAAAATTAGAKAAASTTTAAAPAAAPATGVIGTAKKVVDVATNPGPGIVRPAARVAALPATVYQREKQAALEQQASTGFAPDDDSPAAMHARSRNDRDPSTGQPRSDADRWKVTEASTMALASQRLVAGKTTLEDELEKLSQIPKYKDILDKYHRLVRRRGQKYAQTLADRAKADGFRGVVEEIEGKGRAPQAARAHRPAASKPRAQHSQQQHHQSKAKPKPKPKPKPKKQRRSHQNNGSGGAGDSGDSADEGDDG